MHTDTPLEDTRMKRTSFSFRAALLLPLATIAAQTTNSEGHKGFHAAVGLGYGSAVATCNGCSSDRETNPAIMLRFGGAVNPGLVLSGEINGWSKEKNGATTTISWVNFVAQLYPTPTSGFYWKGGVGYAAATETVAGAKAEAMGFGVVGGIGYDIAMGRSFSLTPYIDLLWMSKADAKFNGTSSGFDVGANLVHIGLSASWR